MGTETCRLCDGSGYKNKHGDRCHVCGGSGSVDDGVPSHNCYENADWAGDTGGGSCTVCGAHVRDR